MLAWLMEWMSMNYCGLQVNGHANLCMKMKTLIHYQAYDDWIITIKYIDRNKILPYVWIIFLKITSLPCEFIAINICIKILMSKWATFIWINYEPKQTKVKQKQKLLVCCYPYPIVLLNLLIYINIYYVDLSHGCIMYILIIFKEKN